MDEINLKRNIALTTSSQALTMLASFVVNWYLARYLGTELRGQYIYLFTINSVVWLLLDLGVSKSMMYSLQRDKADPSALYSMSLIFFGISLIISIAAFRLFSTQIIGKHSYPMVVLYALSAYIALFQLHTRQKVISIGLNRIRDYSLLLTLPTLAFMCLILPLFWVFSASFRMQGSYLLYVSTMLAITLIFHFRIARQIKFRFRFDLPLIKRSYGLGFKAFLSEYMAILMTRVDVLLLKRLGSFSDLGIYMLAINFVDIINVTGNMIGVVLLNKFSALNDDHTSLVILRKVFVLMIVFNLICILGMAILGPFVINMLYTNQYIGAYQTFMYMIPAIFGLTLGSLFNTFLWSKGFPIFTIVAPAVTMLIKAIACSILIPIRGYPGAAIASSIAYPLWLLMLFVWYFSTHRGSRFSILVVRKADFAGIRSMVGSLLRKEKVRF